MRKNVRFEKQIGGKYSDNKYAVWLWVCCTLCVLLPGLTRNAGACDQGCERKEKHTWVKVKNDQLGRRNCSSLGGIGGGVVGVQVPTQI
jgi:hypothetical protein